ncbi:MAG: thioredoxin [Zetaproteobacteria bacterium CG2_30_46_52]|nr:MAG: thioredoxin [Zetaproteobacteria bacterium CG2_30_46_52]
MSENIHIVCHACDAVNRLPLAKLESVANCARCKKRLLAGDVKSLTQDNFDAFIANNDLPVVVDFWAPWCGPCKMMAPAFEKTAMTLSTKAILAKVNTEEQQALGARFAIRSIPTLMMFKDGREVRRQSGAMDAAALQRWIMGA